LAVGGCFGSVEADKNDRTKVEEQDGSVVISDENADGQEVMPETAMTTEWDKIDKLKEKYPEMITFTDVPEGMEFVSVEVKEQDFGAVDIEYCFTYNSNSVEIFQEYFKDKKQQTQLIETPDDYMEYKKYKVNIERKSEIVVATVFDERKVIDIIGPINKEEVFKIIDKIKASD
ncbi:MAG: DUF4367 domain-containing protein, partial [Clostridiales bacterium]|nr:DUF4367 domain-containing protein [Clostridiales bacterium]